MPAPSLSSTAQEGSIPPLPHDVVARLALARKSARMTQAELAERAGLSRMTVQRLESNGLDPRLSTLNEMARVLGYELVAIPAALRASCDSLVQEHLAAVRTPAHEATPVPAAAHPSAPAAD